MVECCGDLPRAPGAGPDTYRSQWIQDTLHQIEQILGHEFTDTALLAKAFTHSSSVDNRLDSNERLEFLGDAILSIVICQKLFEKFERVPGRAS